MSDEQPTTSSGDPPPPEAKPEEMKMEIPVPIPEVTPAPAPGAETAKKQRRASMFAEATTAKDLVTQNPEVGDISTLQAFFKEPTLGNQDKSSSKNKSQIRRPKLVFENTYRLESKKPFVASRVEALIRDTLEELLFDLRYCSKTASTMCSQVAETIRNRVMAYEYERYKLVVHVALGSMSRQGFCIAFKHLGDSNRDSYAQGSFTNHHIFAAVSVHAIYYE